MILLRWPTTVTAKQKVTAKQRKLVGQRLLFASEMVGRVTVTVTHCSLEKTAIFRVCSQSTLIRAHDVLHRLWFGGR